MTFNGGEWATSYCGHFTYYVRGRGKIFFSRFICSGEDVNLLAFKQVSVVTY
jgi:hypothetical protein